MGTSYPRDPRGEPHFGWAMIRSASLPLDLDGGSSANSSAIATLSMNFSQRMVYPHLTVGASFACFVACIARHLAYSSSNR